MTTTTNERTARLAVSTFQEGDIDALVQLVTEDVVWHAPGRNDVAGTYRGREGVAEFFARVYEATEGTITLELDDVLVSDAHIVLFLRIRAHRDGESIDELLASPATMTPDGLVAESWFLPTDQRAHDEFFSVKSRATHAGRGGRA